MYQDWSFSNGFYRIIYDFPKKIIFNLASIGGFDMVTEFLGDYKFKSYCC